MDLLRLLYKRITLEDVPDNVQLTVFPLKQYIEIYKSAYGEEPDLSKWDGGYTGNIEFTHGNREESNIIVLENIEDFLFESISHGIGHVKYAMEFFKRNPKGDLMKDTDKIVRETAAHTAGQRALDRNNPKKYIKTPYYQTVYWLGDSQDKIGTGYTAKLIQKYGIDKAWKKILNIEKEEKLKRLIAKRFLIFNSAQ
jgi:hypothetical protein